MWWRRLYPFMVLLMGWAVVSMVLGGRPWLGAGYGVLALALLWWTSPWRGRGGTTHREVLQMSDADPRKDVVIYWRPGCGFCARLKSTLGDQREKATWVNIWDDEDGAEFVRSVNDGNETVPTVVIDGIPHTNPDPALVRDRLLQG